MNDLETGPLRGESRLLIDGDLVDASDGGRIANVDPSTGDVAGYAADATPADFERALTAARREADSGRWGADPALRYRALKQLHEALIAERTRLARIIVTESGSPIGLTNGVQLEQPIKEVKFWAEMARDFAYEEEPEFADGGRRMIRYEPTGVVSAITPWNYPFYLDVTEAIPALAAGNTVILRPSQVTPWSGLELGRIVAEHTDIPAGVFQVLTTSSHDTAGVLTSDPRVDMVTFTGSTEVGRKVLAAGAPTIKKTFLELGGKSAHIVLDDADLAVALRSAAAISYHAGQGCTLSTRLLVPRARYAEAQQILTAIFARIPVGDVWDPNVIHGPNVSARHRDAILAAIADGIESGARVLVGGHAIDRPGFYVEPTVLVDVDPAAKVATEEIFGPVLVVIPYDTVDEAVDIANSTIYGLAGEVTAGTEERALAVARRLRAGSIAVNGGGYFGEEVPLGGFGQSGLGRRNGVEGFREYQELKSIGLPAHS